MNNTNSWVRAFVASSTRRTWSGLKKGVARYSLVLAEVSLRLSNDITSFLNSK